MKKPAQVFKYLKMGEGIERKGINFYSNALKRVNDQNSVGLLKMLVGEEKTHLAYFLDLEEEYNEGKKIAPLKKMKQPIFNKEAYNKMGRKDIATYKIFYAALDIEEKSIKLYKGLSKKVKDSSLKKLLVSLAKREKDHYDLIKAHQDSIYISLNWQGFFRQRVES